MSGTKYMVAVNRREQDAGIRINRGKPGMTIGSNQVKRAISHQMSTKLYQTVRVMSGDIVALIEGYLVQNKVIK